MMAQPQSKRRLRHVTCETLEGLFGRPRQRDGGVAAASDPAACGGGGGRRNTVAAQTIMSQTDFALSELLLQRRGSGVVSWEHARDKQSLHRALEHRVVDLLEEEQRQRVAHFVDHRDGIDLLWKFFVQGPRVRASPVFLASSTFSQSLSPPRRLSMASVPSLPDHARASQEWESRSPGDEEHDSPGLPAVHRTQSPAEPSQAERVKLLERRLAKMTRAMAAMMASGNNNSDGGGVRAGGLGAFPAAARWEHQLPHERDAARKARRAALEKREADRRIDIAELETAERRAAAGEALAGQRLLQLQAARRTLVHTPFQGYRPRIPVEAISAEDFLRRWLIAETFKHYDDCLTILQTHENDMRNSIEDAALHTLGTLHSTIFCGAHEAAAQRLGARVEVLERDNATYTAHVAAVVASARLRALEVDEPPLRAAIVEAEADASHMITLVMRQLRSAADIEARVGALRLELSRQRERHVSEVRALRSQLPRDGVRFAVVPYNSATCGAAPVNRTHHPHPPPPAGRSPASATPSELRNPGTRDFWAGF